MQARKKQYTEAELVKQFGLTRITTFQTERMKDWLDTSTVLDSFEQRLFDDIQQDALQNILGWNEEDLKMKFISFVLSLGGLLKGEGFVSFFEKTISAKVEGIFLKTKTDFMIAKGFLNLMETPFFHFQEYKPQLNPTGEPMAQLLEAMLIAQSINQNEMPIYGCEIVGQNWRFVIIEGKSYCISKSFDCTDKEELLQIIAILRKFRKILEIALMN